MTGPEHWLYGGTRRAAELSRRPFPVTAASDGLSLRAVQLSLGRLAGDPANMATFRRLLAEDLPAPDVLRLDDAGVLRQVAWRLDAGRWSVRPALHAYGGGATSAPPEPPSAEAPEEAVPEPPPAADLGWVAFDVIDDETGLPVSGVTLTLRLPDGTVRDVTTGASGSLYLSDLPAGTCDIVEMTDAHALEVVGLT